MWLWCCPARSRVCSFNVHLGAYLLAENEESSFCALARVDRSSSGDTMSGLLFMPNRDRSVSWCANDDLRVQYNVCLWSCVQFSSRARLLSRMSTVKICISCVQTHNPIATTYSSVYALANPTQIWPRARRSRVSLCRQNHKPVHPSHVCGTPPHNIKAQPHMTPSPAHSSGSMLFENLAKSIRQIALKLKSKIVKHRIHTKIS